MISGSQIEVEGYISYIPRELDLRDKDLHFNLSPSVEDDNNSLTNDARTNIWYVKYKMHYYMITK